ncbi:MAG TPA: hypothetical protein VED40_03870 [Azospirillaceae bacterium]|nr:hypothetical protein [Azospirillaceae bacterium]
MAAKKLSYLDPLSKFDDRALFVLAALLGAGGIVGLKAFGFWQLYVTCFPVVVMLAYTGYVWFTKRFRLREDQAGDNAYYLGLLYTLTSLSYALYLFGRNPDAIDDIISNFGIALITTIVGVGLRVMFAQKREDPVEIEREARLELANAASQLRQELLTASGALNTFRQATEQSIAEAMRELKAITEKALRENVDTFSSVAKDLTTRVGASLEEHTVHAQKLSQASGRTVMAVEKLVQRVEEIAPAPDLLERKVVPHFDEVDAIIARMSARTAADGDHVESIGRSVAQLVTAVAGLEQRMQSLAGSGAPVDMVGARLKALADGLEGATRNIQGVAQSMGGTLKAIEQHNAGLATELAASRAATTEVQRALAEMSRALAEQINTERRSPAGVA